MILKLMNNKSKTIFLCGDCGNETMSWSGQCPSCKAWNTLKEFKIGKAKATKTISSTRPTPLHQIKTSNQPRIKTGFEEVDRVFGGGIMPGSMILIAGDPGIGKSTLLLQIAGEIKKPVLYVSGEESDHQIKNRAERLKIKNKEIDFLAETEIENIKIAFENHDYQLAIIDSIQTVYDANIPAAAGSPSQIRECALQFLEIAKRKNLIIVLVGHVTKEGVVAGPRLLEHMVDVVSYLEGERYRELRVLRGIKNRFGPTDEIGVFEMKNDGLVEVKNPSAMFLKERKENASGSIVTAIMEGTRPLLTEVQALVTRTFLPYPRRTTSGFDLNRLQLITAILEKRGDLHLANFDVYINIVGGIKIKEPAADLAVALAIASALKNIAIKKNYCVFGELGLIGEIRPVNFSEKRASEAKRLGFTKIITNHNLKNAIEEVLSETKTGN